MCILHRCKGGAVANKTLEERVTALEQQAEINRQNINQLIETINEIAYKIASAAGAMAKMPRMPHMKTGEETDN